MPKHPQSRLQLPWLQPSTQMMPGLWQEMCRVWQDQPLQRGLQRCKKQNGPQLRIGPTPLPGRRRSYQHCEYQFYQFNSKHPVITSNLKTLSNQVRIIVPYKVDMGSHENIMPLQVCKNVLGQQKNNWQQQEIKTSN